MNSEVQTLQSALYEILDLLEEVRALHPTVCSGAGQMSEDLKLTQSSYIYLQATGSDGTEGVTEGIHLRWALRKELAENHIPKGDLANTGTSYYAQNGYNKDDDYVTIRKTPYINTVPAIVNLGTVNPFAVKTIGNYKRWIYQVTTTPPLGGTIVNKIYVHFYNMTLYNSIGINPLTNAPAFLAAYTDYIEVEVENKLFFRADMTIGSSMGMCNYRYETIYVSDPGTQDDITISSRKVVTTAAPSSVTSVTGENLRFLRLQVMQGVLSTISIETYYDFINTRSWTSVGDFGLTTDNTVAANRLMGSSIDNAWPRFNDDTKVKASNYTDKWTDSEGLKEAVIEYLNLSKTDSRAYKLMDKDQVGDDAKVKLSYVDLLNLVALDHHIARMFGLAHIENFDLMGNKYVYLAEYYTSTDLPNDPYATLKKHLYMSLPTDKSDKRLPLQPAQDDLSFGLPSMDDCNKQGLIDDNGYSLVEPARYINVNRLKYDYEVPYEPFFLQTTQFDTTQITKPVFYGIEYKESAEPDYRKPEITSDPNEQEYFDYDPSDINGVAETIPVPEKANPLFTHRETEIGSHVYALYGINWFSRVSTVSGAKSAITTFTPVSRLVPPIDLAAHYIQEENPRLFTSQDEQTSLAARNTSNPSGDNLWTRVTFNWNHVQKMAYQTADELEFFFRLSGAMEVRGKVSALTSVTGGKSVWIEAGSFNMNSSPDNEFIEPLLNATDYSKFVGSRLVTASGAFDVLEVQTGSTYPRFRVKTILETRTYVDPEEDKMLRQVCIPVGPEKDEYFTVYENLSNTANWTKLDNTISLENFSERTEQITESDGSITEYVVGGIDDTAEIIPDSGPDAIDGLYKIIFDNEILADHPQKTSKQVYWDKGIIRIPEDTAEARMKPLQVVRIESQNPLVVWAIDGVDTSAGSDYEPIQTGTGITANYHPGYRVYLQPESSHNFDKAHMMPDTGEEKRVMMMAVRSKDTGSGLLSALSSPAGFFSLDIRLPQKPNKPQGPAYATRPDMYGKSSYSFDTEVTESPFAIVAYRCHDTALFDALYEPATIDDINETLEALDPNEHQADRFYDLVNTILDTTVGHEDEYVEYDGYRFPFPDKDGLFDPGDTLEEKIDKIKAAVQSAFIPVLDQPAIYDFIKQDGTAPENAPAVMRDINGEMLDNTNPLFNPFPWVRRFTASSKDYVRFADFGLDGGTKNIYFYCLKEMSKRLEFSESSDILGPVFLVNSFPPEAPGIKKIETVLANAALETNAAVKFEVNPYFDSEGISKIRIYRTTDVALSASVRTMQLAGDIDITEAVADDFSDLTFPPFGKDIYYRLVALRKIKNEFEQTEYIPSKPSEVCIAKVVDNINPPAPQLSHIIGGGNDSPVPQLLDVTISWTETCFEGKYHLYKMSASGFWQLVQTFDFSDPLTYTYATLDLEDEDNDPLYHRFKVVAENANGLLSLDEKVLVVHDAPEWFNTLLLDDLSAADISVAYSLRRLRTAYTGTTVRVRNNSNVETDIGFDGYDLDVPAILSHIGATGDGMVVRLRDQMGNTTSDFIQTVPTQQPFIAEMGNIAMATYGKPGLRFKQINSTGMRGNYTVGADFSIYMVVDAQSGIGGIMEQIPTLPNSFDLHYDNGWKMRVNDNSAGNVIDLLLGMGADRMRSLVVMYYNNSTRNLCVKIPGATLYYTLPAVRTAYTSPGNLLGLYSNLVDSLNGCISELIVLNTDMRTIARDADMEMNIKNYWNLYGNNSDRILDYISLSHISSAYSLRQLATDYAGTSIRVRNNLNIEQNIGFIGFNLNQGALLAHVGPNDGRVVKFINQAASGAAADFVQPTPTNQPYIAEMGMITMAAYGQPAIRFKAMQLTHLKAVLPVNQSFSIYMVIDAQGGMGGLLEQGPAILNSFRMYYDAGWKIELYDNTGGNVIDPALGMGTDRMRTLAVMYYDNTTRDVGVRLPGISNNYLLPAVRTSFISPNVLMGIFSNLINAFDGHISEVIVLSEDMRTIGKDADVETNMKTYWGVL